MGKALPGWIKRACGGSVKTAPVGKQLGGPAKKIAAAKKGK